MTTAVRMELSALEAAHLTDLIAQFAQLLAHALDDADDPAIARLVPDAYRDDPQAAAEFRRFTQDDLLDRRRDDAQTVLTSLQREGTVLRAADLAHAVDLPVLGGDLVRRRAGCRRRHRLAAHAHRGAPGHGDAPGDRLG